MKKMNIALFLVFGILVLSSACTPTREDLRNDIAEATCRRAEECGKIGSGEKYSTYDDCYIDRQDFYNDLWPANDCGEGQINEKNAEDCITRAEIQSCDAGFFDNISFVSQCNADKVCTDPRD